MEIKKQKIKQRLIELSQVQIPRWTAMELHAKRALLSRVHRQEVRRYYEDLEVQKVQLNKDLKRIEDYLKSVKNKKKDNTLPKPTIDIKPKLIFRETRLERYRK